jgi:Protein of unknown function (DUF1275)
MRQSAVASFRREEALQIAAMLVLVGGYLDAYAWIVHSTFANAQTANLVFLWVYVTGGEWAKALRCGPPLMAFVLGVISAEICRRQSWADQHPGRDPVSVHRRHPSQQASRPCGHTRYFPHCSDGELSTGRRMDLQLGDGDEQLSSIRRGPVRCIQGERRSKPVPSALCVRNNLHRVRNRSCIGRVGDQGFAPHTALLSPVAMLAVVLLRCEQDHLVAKN